MISLMYYLTDNELRYYSKISNHTPTMLTNPINIRECISCRPSGRMQELYTLHKVGFN